MLKENNGVVQYPRYVDGVPLSEQKNRVYRVSVFCRIASERQEEREAYVVAGGFDEAVEKAKKFYLGQPRSGIFWNGTPSKVTEVEVRFVEYSSMINFLV